MANKKNNITYRIISTTDGSIINCSLSELAYNLKSNCILAEHNKDNILIDSWPLTQNILVFFSVEFANYAMNHYAKVKSLEAETCITLVRQWLDDPGSVTNAQLIAAADAAANLTNTVNTRTSSTFSATNAAFGTAAAAANAAADVAYAAANFVTHAASFACAAANLSGVTSKIEQLRQGRFIVKHLKAENELLSAEL